MEMLLRLDGNCLIFIQEHLRNTILDPVMIGITRLGDAGIVWILLTILLLAFARTRKTGLQVGCALICMLVANDLIMKNVFARTRPYEVVPGLVRLIEEQTDFSFPSGHTAVSFAAVAALWNSSLKSYRPGFLALAILIAFSRLYLGVHYPTDVLGGIVVGVLCGCLGVWISGWLDKNYSDRRKQDGR